MQTGTEESHSVALRCNECNYERKKKTALQKNIKVRNTKESLQHLRHLLKI